MFSLALSLFLFPLYIRLNSKTADEVDLIDSGTEGEPIEKLYKGDGQLIIDLKQVKILNLWKEKQV